MAVPPGGHHFTLAQISQMLGNEHLGFAETRLDVTDTEGRLGEQIKNTQAGFIAQALVNLD